MKQILLLLLFSTTLTFSSCKKCWTCNQKVDGNDVKVCDEATKEQTEQIRLTDKSGNFTGYVQCN